MMPLKRVLPALILVVGLAACTESKPPAPPTEQQIHSSDSAVATGEMGRHPYRCSDGEPLFVDYKDNGLQIDLRRSSSAVPMTLTAPAQGLQYVGETATATFKGPQLTVVVGEGRTRICKRDGHPRTVLPSDTPPWKLGRASWRK